MSKTWRCNNDEHINNIESVECEICGFKRPQITRFYGEQEIDISKPYKIYWETSDAVKTYIVFSKNNIEVNLSGFFTVDILGTLKKITLVVVNNYTTISKDLIITVPDPEILYFYSNKSVVLPETVVLVSWKVKNSIQQIINNTHNLLDQEGKDSIKIPKNGIFQLVAKNEASEKFATICVKIVPFSTVAFTSKAAKLIEGSSTELIWKIENAESARLDAGSEILSIPLEGSKVISPSKNQIYKLLITALDGETLLEEITSVTVINPITIKKFKPLNRTLYKGDSTQLTWKVENATEIRILPSNQIVTNSTNLTVLPESTTTYLLTAKNELHSESSECTIEVNRKPVSWWIFVLVGIFVILAGITGWYWNQQNRDHEKVKEIETLLIQGKKIAPDDCDAAKQIFTEVVLLNNSLSNDLKVQSIHTLANEFIEEGDKRCNLNLPALQYIAECNYQLAAILTENPTPQTCK